MQAWVAHLRQRRRFCETCASAFAGRGSRVRNTAKIGTDPTAFKPNAGVDAARPE